jgi:hypothetical protein
MRTLIVIGLLLLGAPAPAQHIEQVKGIKFGGGCVSPVTSYGRRFGACSIGGSKARIWCPNGQIFERVGETPQMYVARSICNLSQLR